MFVKRGVLGLAMLSLGMLFLLLFLSFPSAIASTGQECSLLSTYTCGGLSKSIYNIGTGAVELCGVCHHCGDSDGVCPEHYSDGRNESRSEYGKTLMRMRVKRTPSSFDAYTVAFQTGNKACDALGGNCVKIQKSNYSTFPSGSTVDLTQCSLNVSAGGETNNYYFRAVCANVPRKSDCSGCPDPDCTTMLKGKTYNGSTFVDEVNVSLSTVNPLVQFQSVLSSSVGNYEMLAPTGVVTVTCKKEGYSNSVFSQTLVPGNNIADCYMTNLSLTCNSNCTMGGEQICQAACNSTNGCLFYNTETMDACDGAPYGSTVNITSYPSYYVNASNCSFWNVTTVNCCEGTPVSTLSFIACNQPPPCSENCTNAEGICQAACDGSQNCSFYNTQTMYECDGESFETTINLSIVSYINASNCSFWNVTSVDCCEGIPEVTVIPWGCDVPPLPIPLPPDEEEGENNIISVIPGGEILANVSTIITRNYRKEFNGFPVTLKIIIYKK